MVLDDAEPDKDPTYIFRALRRAGSTMGASASVSGLSFSECAPDEVAFPILLTFGRFACPWRPRIAAVAACFAAAIRFFGLGGSERMMVI